MSDDAPPLLHAFGGYGIELEYMIVDRSSLSVRPIADRLLRDEMTGAVVNEVERGLLAWSNELVLHLIEVKNPRPCATLAMLPEAFQDEVRQINQRLVPLSACLMPGGMHPWMNPATETRLWPHENHAIYHTYDRIFDCRRHGWSNLQSMHINLPFADDHEFARLHAAVRLALPVVPALTASSPIADGKPPGWADYRMHVYADNAREIPSITGMVIPETITSRAAYEKRILTPMYRAIAPHDPAHVLQYEWLNSRGAIPRFERNAIEIRVADTQECPQADLAVATAICAAVRGLYREDEALLVEQQEMRTDALAAILQACIRDAEQTVIEDAGYLRLLGFPAQRCTAQELWTHLTAQLMEDDSLRVILQQGTLARRILRAVGPQCTRSRLETVYRRLCECLHKGRMFI